jgi:Ca-activated chloride channel family protein
MRFGNIVYLMILWVVPALVLFYVYSFRKKNRLIELFAERQLFLQLTPGISHRRNVFKAILLVLAVIFAVLALIRPKWGYHWEEIKRKGVDIVICIDVSSSMLAEDIMPNRLERAKRKINDLLNLLEGDRIGLVAFAGTSFVQCPLTLDYGACSIFLDYLDTDLIPIQGTALGEAIRTGIGCFPQGERKSRAIILITDGEDHQGDPLSAAEEAKKEGVRIFAIGIGKEGGAPIPDPGGGFKKDSTGSLILSKLDEVTLQKIALETGGGYVRSVTGDLDLEKIYLQNIRKTIEQKELESTRRKRWEERFQWPLLFAVILLGAESLYGEKKRSRERTAADTIDAPAKGPQGNRRRKIF